MRFMCVSAGIRQMKDWCLIAVGGQENNGAKQLPFQSLLMTKALFVSFSSAAFSFHRDDSIEAAVSPVN